MQLLTTNPTEYITLPAKDAKIFVLVGFVYFPAKAASIQKTAKIIRNRRLETCAFAEVKNSYITIGAPKNVLFVEQYTILLLMDGKDDHD